MEIEYDCSAPDRVSVWYGHFESEDTFSDYIEVSFTDNGESSSFFLKDFSMADFDEDFTESFFFENERVLHKTLPDFSYAETFIDHISGDVKAIDMKGQNSILFVYDCDASFMKEYKSRKMTLLGVYDYHK